MSSLVLQFQSGAVIGKDTQSGYPQVKTSKLSHYGLIYPRRLIGEAVSLVAVQYLRML